MAGKKKKNAGEKVITLEQKGKDIPAAPSGKKPKRAFRYPGRGKPKTYTDPLKLAGGCERYFATISRTEVVRDDRGRPILNDMGEVVERIVWLVQPSEEELARSLGITSRTLRNYKTSEELGPVVEWALDVCKSWYLELVTDRTNKNSKGAVFVLQNCYGMKEQVAVEHSGERIEEYLARLEAGAERTEF